MCSCSHGCLDERFLLHLVVRRLDCYGNLQFIPITSFVEWGKSGLIGLIFCFVALNGTPKCNMKKTKKKDKMQEQESPPDMDSMVAAEAEEQEEAKGRGMEGQEAVDAAASCICACIPPFTLT